MGLLGTYVAALNDTERDRVIEAQRWYRLAYERNHGARCLVGHAEGADPFTHPKADALSELDVNVERVFDTAWWRFGRDRLIRAIKLRCAMPDRAERIARARAAKGHALPVAALREPAPVAG